MAACMSFWFIPFVSGTICNASETLLISQILKAFGCYSEAATDALFWFIRKKMLLVNVATYVPVAGVPLQLFETYAMGQFAICCASEPQLVGDEKWMTRNWKRIEKEIFSGARVVRAYEQLTGAHFPDYARDDFISFVDLLSKSYRLTQRIPGLRVFQETAGETLRQSLKLAEISANGLAQTLKKKFRR
jgi:hypothetical protein